MVRSFGNLVSSILFILLQVTTAAAAAPLVAKLDAAITKGDKAALDDLLAPDFRQNGETDELFPRPITRNVYFGEITRLGQIFRNFSRHSKILAANDNSLALMVTYSGVQAGTYLNQPPSGNNVTITALEVWRLDHGKLAELWRQSDDITTLRQITIWQPEPDLQFNPAKSREIVHFPAGRFLESIVADDKGNLYFTTLLTGKITKLAPDGTLSAFADLPVGGKPGKIEGIMCLVRNDDGTFFADVMAPGTPHHGIWKIDPDGKPTHFATLPDEVIPNGIASDRNGHLYIADSGAGGIWQINLKDHSASRWYNGDALRRRPYIGIYPPANGLQYWRGSLYATNSDRAQIVRIPVEADGRAGSAQIHATGVPGDDFAIDDNGILYVTTHPYNLVMRVDRDGKRTVVATPKEGIVGPTSAVFAKRDGNARKLYVITDGGFYNPLPDRPQRPNLVELDINSR